MLANDDFMKFLAAWQLVHEAADEGLKAAIERGENQQTGELSTGPGAFVDGLSALVCERKDQLKAELSGESSGQGTSNVAPTQAIEALTFEVSTLRAELESMRSTLDALATKIL